MIQQHRQNLNFFYTYLETALRHSFAPSLALCRRSLPLSPQLHSKDRQLFPYLPKLPYLCIVDKTKGHSLNNSINIKKIKIMKQQNEMSARALTMEEMENVNGGFIGGRGKFGPKKK